MYGRGNFPPPYQHPSQLPPQSQMRPTAPQGSLNSPYPAPTSHSYPIPNTTQQYSQTLPQQIPPPPPRLPFLPNQPLYRSLATSSPNFTPAPPPIQFGPLGTNPAVTTSVPISTLPPPPPSLPPPAMPPPPPAMPLPPDVTPKLDGEEVVADTERLDSADGPNLEAEKAGSVSPALSDMDMEGI